MNFLFCSDFYLCSSGSRHGTPVQPSLRPQRPRCPKLSNQQSEEGQGVLAQPQQGRLQQVKKNSASTRGCELSGVKFFSLPHVCTASTITTDSRGSRCAGCRQSPSLRTTCPPSRTCGPLACWCGKYSVTGKCHIPNSAMMRSWKVRKASFSQNRRRVSMFLIWVIGRLCCRFEGGEAEAAPPRGMPL